MGAVTARQRTRLSFTYGQRGSSKMHHGQESKAAEPKMLQGLLAQSLGSGGLSHTAEPCRTTPHTWEPPTNRPAGLTCHLRQVRSDTTS